MITRICPGSRWSGTSGTAGTAARSAGSPFTLLGDHVTELLGWQVIVRVAAHCRRYKRACSCRVPATVMAPGPPKATGRGLFSNAFIAMLLPSARWEGAGQRQLADFWRGNSVAAVVVAGLGSAGLLLAIRPFPWDTTWSDTTPTGPS